MVSSLLFFILSYCLDDSFFLLFVFRIITAMFSFVFFIMSRRRNLNLLWFLFSVFF